MFDDGDDRLVAARDELRSLLGTEDRWRSARRATLNAHYTSADVVQAMWQVAEDLGFDGDGLVLEPGCGAGNFLAFAPPQAQVVGVELDPTTAEITRHLYGARSMIQAVAFEDFRESDGVFDLAIGNVPFGKVTPYDPRHNRGRHALHNYFLVKSLRLVRPGGLLVMLTSRYTLDARTQAARREMATLADLVGALRLPERAFAASSGTDVVTDLVVLQRRLPGREPVGPRWTNTVDADVEAAGPGASPLVLNEYFAQHPDRILGRLAVGRGMYRDRELTVTPTGSLDEQVADGLRRLVDDAQGVGLAYAPRAQPAAAQPSSTASAEASEVFSLTWAQDGSFVVSTNGRIGRLVGGHVEPYVPRVRKDAAELRHLAKLRDNARILLDLQVGGGNDFELDGAQRALAQHYENYVRRFGPINRSTQVRTGRIDARSGEEATRRARPRMGGFRDDPDWPLIAALEVFDEDTQQARPAAIFTERVIEPPKQRLGVDTAEEAVAVCLDETGSVTTERVAELLGIDQDAVRSELSGLVYADPDDGRLIPASQYLSGNVRRKLDACRAVVESRPELHENIEALERVLPRQLEPFEITARLGASWIPSTDIEQFCAEVLDSTVDVERLPEVGQWTVRLREGSRRGVALSSEWGTARADAVTLLEASLNQRLHTVTDPTTDKRRVRNDAETLAARDKQEQLATRFATWVWEDPGRARRLAEGYNARFSSTVLPTYDGSHLSLPGLSGAFEPRPHQRDAVARVLTDGRALLAHAVGAGKTATMVIGAMELRRLGLVSKPAIVVPNHMLDQFTREWLQLYPTARILVADRSRLSKERRKEFVARAATGDWDGVLFTHAGFARLPLARELLGDYLGEEIDAARQALATSKQGKALSVKRLERRIAQMEQSYKRLLAEDAKDDGVRFDETGIDYLFIDEAHAYKNRRIDTSIDGVAALGSQRAQDLDAKLWALRRVHGPRVTTFATATPVTNSMAELWVMQSYLHPDVLAEVDLRAFDDWAATFGRTHTALELAPDGASYRMQTRFARFQNVPELLTLYRQVADVRTADDLDLPTPDVPAGPETIVTEPSSELADYVADLAARAEQIRNRTVDPSDDNMLKVTGDGRRAALDLRLVDPAIQPAEGKLAAAARRIAATFHEHRANTYLDSAGEPSPRPGGLQLVFCDVSTPAGSGWNAYDELRALLTERGVPDRAIRYVQGAAGDVAKAQLFAACREGGVAVLLGSTETMGVGTNVQARAVAVHHLDAPWRPADIEQRDGRVLRQGNQNASIEVVRYVTEGSFDTYMWQTLERKAGFIAQITRGDLPDRDVEDIGDQALSFAEVKALATGDPLVLEKAGVDAEVARLARLERSHQDNQHRLRHGLAASEQRARGCNARADQLAKAIDQLVDTRGDHFAMTIDGAHLTKRARAGERLKSLVLQQLDATPPESTRPPIEVARLGGLSVYAQTSTTGDEQVRLTIPDARIDLAYDRSEWNTADPLKLVARLERQLHRLPDALASARANAEEASAEAARARALVDQPFDQADRLTKLRRRQHEIDEKLAATATLPAEPEHPQPAASPQVTGDSELQERVSRTRQRLDTIGDEHTAARSVAFPPE